MDKSGGKPKALAYQLGKRVPHVKGSVKFTLVLLDCLFLGLQPVLVHLSKNTDGHYSFQPLAVNFLTELAKTVYAGVVLLFLGSGRPGPFLFQSTRAFAIDAHHNQLLLVPAVLYAVNNFLKFTVQLFFHPTTTKMLGNLKIFTIAMLMRVVMKRNFNVIQWEALFLLVAGITVNQLSTRTCSTLATDASFPVLPAVLSTVAVCTVPSAASVYNEFALKKHMDTSVHLQNFFLYFYGMVFNLGALIAVSAWKGQGLYAIFAGQNSVTTLLIINNAAQGILSSFFYKYADTILKKYSSTIATIFTALMSWVLFGHNLTLNFMLGVSIVLISMHQFFTFGDKPAVTAKLQAEQLKGAEGGLPFTRSTPATESSRKVDPALASMVYSPSLDHIVTLGGGNGDVPQERKSQAGLATHSIPQDRRSAPSAGQAGPGSSRLGVGSLGSNPDFVRGVGHMDHAQNLTGVERQGATGQPPMAYQGGNIGRPVPARGDMAGHVQSLQGAGQPPMAYQGGFIGRPVPPRGDSVGLGAEQPSLVHQGGGIGRPVLARGEVAGPAQTSWVDAQEELHGGAEGSGGVGGGWVAVRVPGGRGGVLV